MMRRKTASGFLMLLGVLSIITSLVAGFTMPRYPLSVLHLIVIFGGVLGMLGSFLGGAYLVGGRRAVTSGWGKEAKHFVFSFIGVAIAAPGAYIVIFALPYGLDTPLTVGTAFLLIIGFGIVWLGNSFALEAISDEEKK
jgi:hypothetical protein